MAAKGHMSKAIGPDSKGIHRAGDEPSRKELGFGDYCTECCRCWGHQRRQLKAPPSGKGSTARISFRRPLEIARPKQIWLEKHQINDLGLVT